jgi:muramidase (phage lysozyme)
MAEDWSQFQPVDERALLGPSFTQAVRAQGAPQLGATATPPQPIFSGPPSAMVPPGMNLIDYLRLTQPTLFDRPAPKSTSTGSVLGDANAPRPMQFGLFGRGPAGSDLGIATSDPELARRMGIVTSTANGLTDWQKQRLQQLEGYVASPYWKAFANTIGWSERAGYSTIGGQPAFSRSFDPDLDSYPGRRSGIFQILPDTYSGLSSDLGLTDFSPSTQNLMAAELVLGKGAMPAIMRGDLASALPRLAHTWVSLPQGPGLPGVNRRQKAHSFGDVMTIYQQELRRALGEPPAP